MNIMSNIKAAIKFLKEEEKDVEEALQQEEDRIGRKEKDRVVAENKEKLKIIQNRMYIRQMQELQKESMTIRCEQVKQLTQEAQTARAKYMETLSKLSCDLLNVPGNPKTTIAITYTPLQASHSLSQVSSVSGSSTIGPSSCTTPRRRPNARRSS